MRTAKVVIEYPLCMLLMVISKLSSIFSKLTTDQLDYFNLNGWVPLFTKFTIISTISTISTPEPLFQTQNIC